MPRDADRVSEASTTTGTGSLTLAGAVGGHRTFLAALGSGSTSVYYGVVQDGSGEWETGIGTFISGSNILQRDVVLASSTGGSKVAFPAGTKIVYISGLAETNQTIRSRRASDIGLELIPASGQSAAMIHVKREDGGDAFTVSATGATRTGRIDVVASAPTLQISDTDQTLPAGRWRWRGSEGALIMERSTSGNFSAAQTVMTFEAAGFITFPRVTTFSSAVTLGTDVALGGKIDFGSRAAATRADLSKHVDLWGGSYGVSITADSLNFVKPPSARFYFVDASTGDVEAQINPAGVAAPNALVVMTREKGDNRYAPISSSRRWKRDIHDAGLIDISQIAVRSYVMERDGHPMQGRRTIGFIAEEVAEAMPEAVIFDADGRPMGLDPLAMLAGFVADFRDRFAAIETRLEGSLHARQARSRKRA